jgi:hypothetical protein
MSALSVPAFLLRSVQSSIINSDCGIGRAQNVFRAVKAFLVRSSGHSFLHSIRFIVPKPSDPSPDLVFSKYQSTLRRVFQGSIIEK